MKLSIEIELQPEEIPLATDLLKVLKQLTQSVRTRNAERLFKASIARSEDPAQLDHAVNDINSLIDLSNGSDEIVTHFFAAFVDVAFQPDLLARRMQSVAYFFYQLLPRLPESIKGRLRERLLAQVIKFLTLPRAVDANRMEFFAYAECFGIMVKLQYIAVTAAVATVVAMLGKAETTAAAITMLGKTVELSAPMLKERCDPAKLNELRAALLKVTDDIFRYDITYIEENLGLNRGAPTANSASGPSPYAVQQGAARPVAQVSRSLAPRESFVGHRSTLFAMVYDVHNDGIISSGKDGVVIAWTRDGQPKQTIVLQRHYACSMDLNPKHRVMYMCGVAKDASAAPAIIAYGLNDKGAWLPRGSILEKPNRLFSCVKALTQDAGDTFVTGESSKQDAKHSIMLYDASTSSLDKLRPLSVWEEHADLITCLASYPNGDGIFFSGSRDCSVKVWDKRMVESVGSFGPSPPGGKPRAHEMMITCLDSYDNMVLSGSLDKFVCAWDLRMMAPAQFVQPLRRIAVDTTAILKVAGCAGTPYLAASTLEGLRLIDLDTGAHTAAHAFQDGRKPGRYHDLRWNTARDTLFAAGDEGRVDLYSTIVQGP